MLLSHLVDALKTIIISGVIWRGYYQIIGLKYPFSMIAQSSACPCRKYEDGANEAGSISLWLSKGRISSSTYFGELTQLQ